MELQTSKKLRQNLFHWFRQVKFAWFDFMLLQPNFDASKVNKVN